ncbi:hypothetical protein JOD64_005572 [Micromonospora luteifusca]|uniref:Uncharacterized protein n=1 Tax=Micromonospora luteifusca TaxID=709860 RepID=A0ABS2M1N6_9ACTN|nr:hypothetical protein [Micromonospora luteifusca]MBM7494350.1 hypothetical protein [Micromonospora luteifusca]
MLEPARWGWTGVRALLACLVVLPSAGCAPSGHDRAREWALERAEQVAHETEPWATDSTSLKGWKSNQSVLNRLVAETGGERLTSSIHDPDERGVGLLATVEIMMVGRVSEGWLAGDEVSYNICVRFDVRRQTSGPRDITPVTVDCPHEVPATRAPQ